MITLGLSFGYHDAAAALIVDGEIAFAAHEERFTRKKGDASFPQYAIQAALKATGLTVANLDSIAFYELPDLKLQRQTAASKDSPYLSRRQARRMLDRRSRMNRASLMDEFSRSGFSMGRFSGDVVAFEHHASHAASAFFPSPFKTAAILTLDGVGEWATSSIGVGRDRSLFLLREMRYPHSIGLIYSAVTEMLGFKVNSGEYKVMGLAPYGNPRYAKLIREEIIWRAADGSYEVNVDLFDDWVKPSFATEGLQELLGIKKRGEEDALSQVHADLAASIQVVLNEIVVDLAKQAVVAADSPNLCMAGGVALNCVANSQILKETDVEAIFVQPAAGDAGGALGAALLAFYEATDKPRQVGIPDAMSGAYLGSQFSRSEAKRELDNESAVYVEFSDDAALLDAVVDCLVDQGAVGWFQGRAEYGPRSLGNRSILADPRSPEVQRRLNLKTKFRESFRPFAPAVLADHADNWFIMGSESPYMLFTFQVKGAVIAPQEDLEGSPLSPSRLGLVRSAIPAVTHLDLSARVQTVRSDTNPRFYALLARFFERTGCPVLVNTSFNVRGEPIVNRPLDAFRCFMGTDLDLLVIENLLLRKSSQVCQEIPEYSRNFKPD